MHKAINPSRISPLKLFPSLKASKMPLGLIMGIGRAFRRKRTSSLDILTSKRSPRGYYKGKNCKPTGFHTRKGGYVVVPEKLPNYVVPDLTDFKLKPYVSQCAREVTEAADSAK
ncbi:39S ribosomal protein L41-A, mitochondrial-like isoform X1 [Olea europaea var. sylvestris]|nr:39S ribosomal protein L41-A, mitochondrial-like isoform X1 [Olea europaea var. sylvestris]